MATQLKFKPVAKDCLFYSRWQYCISFFLPEASVLKNVDHEYIDTIVERRRIWREVAQQRWASARPSGKKSPPAISTTILTRRWREITDDDLKNLHTLADILINTTTPYKLVTSVDQGWVYTNDVALIEELAQNENLAYQQYSEAILARPKNTIKLKNPRHTYRSYLKTVKLTDKDKDNLIKFFVNQSPEIRVSPALQDWLISDYHRTQDYFFVDHNGESWLVMLALVKAGIIRKTVELISA
jgi:hypothetical protein